MPEPFAREDLLHHYTDINGLIGILQSRTLYATDARFLNDAKEVRFGADLLKRELHAKADQLRKENEPLGDRWPASEIAEMLVACVYQLGYFQSHVPFVACLSGARDRLSQWRGYGSSGYAIGLRRSAVAAELPSSATDSGRRPRLERIRYGVAAEEMMTEMAEAAVVDAIEHGPGGHPGSASFFRVERLLADAMALAKDEAFEEEDEWRILIPTPSEIVFRPSTLGPIPFTRVAFPERAVAEVIVGPGGDSELRVAGVGALLESHFSDAWRIPVAVSEVPFRG